MSSSRGWRGIVAGPAGVAGVATLLTLAMAGPVLLDPAERLFGSEIVGRHPDPFIVIAQLESPRPLGLYTQPATDYLGAALARGLGGGISAYNVLVLLSFPLAAFFAALLAVHLARSVAASWFAGLVYAFAPFHVAHAAYHPHVAQTQWLPLYLLALWRCCDRASPGRIVLLILAATLVFLSNFYYGLVAAVLTPVALVAYWLLVARRSDNRSPRGPAITVAALLLLAAGGVAYVGAWAPQVLENRSDLAFPRADLDLYAARWYDYLAPQIEHPLLGTRVQGARQQREDPGTLERQLTLGLGLLVLAAVATVAGARSRGGRASGVVLLLLILATGALVCSLAPEWRIGGLTLTRPSGLLYALAPMFRAYARFGVVVLLAAALLGGIGVATLLRGTRRARVAGWVLVTVTVFELVPFPPWRWRDVLPTSAHRWLVERAEPAKVFDCVPSWNRDRISLAVLPLRGLSLTLSSDDCDPPQFAELLAASGFSHMLVRSTHALAERWTSRPPAAGLTRLGEFQDALLFTVGAEPSTVMMSFQDGFSWRQYKDGLGYRWMGQSGRLRIAVAGGRPVRAFLDLTLHAFPDRRSVAVELDGQPIAELMVDTEVRTYRLGPLDLPPGRRALRLTSREPAAVPDDLLHNGDLRSLTVAVWDWRWAREATDLPRPPAVAAPDVPGRRAH